MPLSLSSLVSVTIALSAPGITRQGFGIPLILSNTGDAWATAERVRTYDISTDLTEVEADFPTTTPEYQAAAAIAAQPSPPEEIMIGKGTLLPTRTLTISITTVSNSTLYKVNAYNSGAAWSAEYTSDGTATNDEIVAGLVAMLTPSAWTSLTAYSAGDRVLHDTGKIYECTVAGTSGGAATAATVTSAAGPFDFRALGANQLSVQFNAGGAQNFNITATAATKAGAAAAFAWTGNFTFKVNGGPVQTITGAGVAAVADLVILINATAFDCVAVANGANVDLVSDRKGTAATVEIVSVTDTIGNCGFTAGTATGGGTVANSGGVTAAELAAIMAAITNGTATAVSNALVLTSTTTGAGGTATVLAASTADTIMGGEFATNVVKTGIAAGTGAGPTGTSSSITDGSVTWEYIATPNFAAAATGGVGSTIVTATGSAAGDWFCLEPLASGDESAVSDLMRLTDTTTDPGVATDLTAILNASSAWYALCLLFKSEAIVATANTGASAWCASNKRLLVVASADTMSATVAYASGTDNLHDLAAAGSSYTAGQWHPRDYEFLDAATLGYFLSMSPGSDNWRMKTLTGPTAVSLTSTQIGYLDARRAGYYVALGSTGVSVLAGGGYVMSTTYAFIDNRRNLDWYEINLQADLVDLLVANNKLPNTNAGRRVIASAIAARNDAGIAAGVISPDPLDPTNAQAPIMVPYLVAVPDVSDASSFTAATRALSGVTTRWKLAGAINSMGVTVNVTQ